MIEHKIEVIEDRLKDLITENNEIQIPLCTGSKGSCRFQEYGSCVNCLLAWLKGENE